MRVLIAVALLASPLAPHYGHPLGETRIPEGPCERQMVNLSTHPEVPGGKRSWQLLAAGEGLGQGRGTAGRGGGEGGEDREGDLGENLSGRTFLGLLAQ